MSVELDHVSVSYKWLDKEIVVKLRFIVLFLLYILLIHVVITSEKKKTANNLFSLIDMYL